jgi:hypothetical protein
MCLMVALRGNLRCESVNAAEPSELARVVKEFSQVSLQLQQLQKQVGDVKEQVGDVKVQLQEQVGGVKVQLQKQMEDVQEQVGDVNVQLQKQMEDVKEQVGDVNVQLQKQMEDVKEQVGNIKEQVEVVMAQVDSSSSFLPSVTEYDKGVHVSNSTVRLIVPKSLSAEETEALWPEVCWKNQKGLSLEKNFKELLSGLIDDASTCWKIKFTGSSPSVCGPVAKPDVVIYKRPPSEKIDPVALTTGAILELQSGPGKYNSNANIGKAARYGEKMLENLMGFRRSVLVGVMDLEKVQWFKVIRVNKERFKYKVHCELNDVRGSLCALLKSSLSDLEVELPVLTVSGVEYEPIRFLGSGAISNVLCVKDEDGREYAAKIPLHGRNLQNDYRMLTCLNDVKGVPKALRWFDDDTSLQIHPVGERISHKLISSCWSLVPGLVDVLERAHKRGTINRDVRPDNIMIAKGEFEETEVLYILDWGFAVTKGESYPFSGGVMYASERILKQLASGDHYVVVDERDDTEALIHTIFALRYKLKNKMLRRMNRRNYDGIRRFWSECYEEYPGWQSAWMAACSGDYVELKNELQKMIP